MPTSNAKILESFSRSLDEMQAIWARVNRDPVLHTNLCRTIHMLAGRFHQGHKILIAGNGGSAAEAQHFAAELVCKYEKKRRALPALALTTDTSILTAWSNDNSYVDVFSRQIEALGRANDVFFGISTSGESPNIINALHYAQEQGLTTISLLGKGGGRAKEFSHISLLVPGDSTPRIQEFQLFIIHEICGGLDLCFD